MPGLADMLGQMQGPADPSAPYMTGAPQPASEAPGVDIMSIIQQLLQQTGQGQQPMQDMPVPQEPSRGQRIGAIILSALGNPQGQEFLHNNEQDRMQVMQQNAMQGRLAQQAQAGQRGQLLSTLLSQLSQQRSQEGMDRRAADTQAGQDRRAGEAQAGMDSRLMAALGSQEDRAAAGLKQRDEQFDARYGLMKEGLDIGKARLGLMQDRLDLSERLAAAKKEMQTTGRPLPAGESAKISDISSAWNQVKTAKSIFGKLGKPGTAMGSGLIPQRFRTNEMKKWSALWTSIRSPIRKAFSGANVTATEMKDMEDLLVQIGTDPQSTEAALDAIEQMFNNKLQERIRGFELSGFNVDALQQIFDESGIPGDLIEVRSQ